MDKNLRLCDITIHESRYIGSGSDSEPADFTIEIEIGEYPESIDNEKVYLHVTRDGIKDLLTQLDLMKATCGLVSDMDRMEHITDIEENIVAIKEQIMLPEEWQDKVDKAFEPMNRAIDLLERGFDKKMELIDTRITKIENIKVKGGKLVT